MFVFGFLPFIICCCVSISMGNLDTDIPVSLGTVSTKSSVISAVVKGNAEFGLRLYDKVRKGDRSNLLMSPYGISSVMAMVSVGAKGKTMEEIMKGMNFPVMKELIAGYSHIFRSIRGNDDFILAITNRLFVHKEYKLLEDFINVMKEQFNGVAGQTDLTEKEGEVSKDLINKLVVIDTIGKIKDLISTGDLNEFTRLVLVSAIYFKGDWASKFDSKTTRDDNFYVNEEKVVTVPMMIKMGDFKIIHSQALNSKMVELPYKGDRVSMYIILPKDKYGIHDVEARLSNIDLLETLSKFDGNQVRERKVKVELPKFKMEKTIEMNELLKQLGMVEMFSENNADFSGITDDKGLFLSKVIQKAFIEVNEEGSEAAASSGVVMMQPRSLPLIGQTTSIFVCDHPFIFFIRDKLTNIVLFSGRVMDPTLG